MHTRYKMVTTNSREYCRHPVLSHHLGSREQKVSKKVHLWLYDGNVKYLIGQKTWGKVDECAWLNDLSISPLCLYLDTCHSFLLFKPGLIFKSLASEGGLLEESWVQGL